MSLVSLVAKICLDATENGPWKVRGKRATDGPSQRSATMIRTTPGMQPVPLNAGNQQNLGHFAHTFNTISLFDIRESIDQKTVTDHLFFSQMVRVRQKVTTAGAASRCSTSTTTTTTGGGTGRTGRARGRRGASRGKGRGKVCRSPAPPSNARLRLPC